MIYRTEIKNLSNYDDDYDELVYKRGDVYFADLRPVVGSEQGGIRPVLIIQNNVGNVYSPTIIVVPLTTKNKKILPTHYELKKESFDFFIQDNIALTEQTRSIDKSRFKQYIGTLDKNTVEEIVHKVVKNLSSIYYAPPKKDGKGGVKNE